MWLLIDDERDLHCDVIARRPDAAKLLLAQMDWECVCFDHDLGDPSVSGYDIMKYAIDYDLLPNHVQLVTSNPVGWGNMKSLLLSAGYRAKDTVNFYKV